MKETFEDISKRKDEFFEQLDLSENAKRNYRNALNSKYLKGMLETECGVDSLFSITDIKTLWSLYSVVNLHPKNISCHRAYSAAIMKYIRFLNNGEKYGKRIDYMRKKGSI